MPECVYVDLGTAQSCTTNFTLSLNRNVTEIDINTTISFCFLLPAAPIVSCELGGVLVNSSNDIVFTESGGMGIVKINNWNVVNLDNGNLNILECESGGPSIRERYYANFYSLSELNQKGF